LRQAGKSCAAFTFEDKYSGPECIHYYEYMSFHSNWSYNEGDLTEEVHGDLTYKKWKSYTTPSDPNTVGGEAFKVEVIDSQGISVRTYYEYCDSNECWYIQPPSGEEDNSDNRAYTGNTHKMMPMPSLVQEKKVCSQRESLLDNMTAIYCAMAV